MKLDTRFFFPPHWRLLIVSSLAINVLALALPLMTVQTYDRIMANHASDTLLVLTLGVGCAALAEMMLRTLRSFIVGAGGAQFEHHASLTGLTRLLHASAPDTNHLPSAVALQDINATSRLKDYYGGQLAATLLVDVPFAFVFLALTFYLVGWLALVPCAILFFSGCVSWRQGVALQRLTAECEEQDDRRYSFITGSLQAIHTLKSLCMEAVTVRRFEEVQRASGSVNFHIAVIQGQSGTFSYTISQIMTVAVLACGAPAVISGHLTVGMLIASVMLSGQVMQPMQRGLALWIKMQDITIAKKRLQALTTREERKFHTLEELGDNHGMVKMEGVRFSYREGEPILDGVSLDIAPGETIAFTGTPGSGRTTLLELLAGLHAPDRGRILLSNMEAWRIPPAERPRFMAYLPTRGVILRGSIMDNLTGFDARHQSQAQEIAELLGIEQAVALLPSGYDTSLDGLATDLVSPGLKQRIAMVRALVRKPRCILYDNADQGLDRESYTRIFDLLAKLKHKATLILVSEDKNILSLADRMVDVRHGTLTPISEPLHYYTAGNAL